MITLRHTTYGKTPFEERLAGRRKLYSSTHNTHKRQTFILLEKLKPTNPKKRLVVGPRQTVRQLGSVYFSLMTTVEIKKSEINKFVIHEIIQVLIINMKNVKRI